MNLVQNPTISSKFRTKINKNRLILVSSGPILQNDPKEIYSKLFLLLIRFPSFRFAVQQHGRTLYCSLSRALHHWQQPWLQ